jgi:uridine kinase
VKVIAISALSGGGKTTLTKALLSRLPGARALHFDDIPGRLLPMDYCEWSEAGADYSQWNLSALEDGLRRLLSEKPAYILVDYPFGGAHPAIAPYLACALWIDTPLDIALARHILRDYLRRDPARRAIENPMAHLEHTLDFYLARHRRAALVHEATVRPTCDFILDGTLPLAEMAEQAARHIAL